MAREPVGVQSVVLGGLGVYRGVWGCFGVFWKFGGFLGHTMQPGIFGNSYSANFEIALCGQFLGHYGDFIRAFWEIFAREYETEKKKKGCGNNPQPYLVLVYID